MIDSSDDVLDIQRLCFGCFGELSAPGPCHRCGYDREEGAGEFPTALAPGTVLAGKYLAGRVLGKPGGFGIAYLGYELNLRARVAIKEYLPRELVTRNSEDGATVVPHSGEDGDLFRYGLEGFLEEARTLAMLEHHNIVQVRDYFEENNTAYLVMKYYEGESLGERLSARGGPLPADELLPVILPILDALKLVHGKKLLHRDIKPANIYITDDARPILLDFGAARQAMGERSRSLSSVLSPGYAPFEQYHRRGNQGPWTDIYAVAATMYRALTGRAPPEANERLAGEPLPAPRSLDPRIPAELEAAILWGLELDVEARPREVAVFESALTGEAPPAPGARATAPPEGAESAKPPREGEPGGVPRGTAPSAAEAGKERGTGRRLGRLLGGVIAVGALAGLAIFLNKWNLPLEPRERLVEALTELTLPQASFLSANGAYAEDVEMLELSTDPDLRVEIREATPLGWSAVASLAGFDEVCSIFVGDASPPPHAVQPGVVGCGAETGASSERLAGRPDTGAAPARPSGDPDAGDAPERPAGDPATGEVPQRVAGAADTAAPREPATDTAARRETPPRTVVPVTPEVEVPETFLEGGFSPDPHVLSLTAGGSVSASTIGSAGCVGYVDQDPDAIVAYSNPASYLSLLADSDTDLTLMVRTPGGAFSCDDDSPVGGLDPMVEFSSPAAGRYQVWVGAYSEGRRPEARLEISEIAIPTPALEGGFVPDPYVLDLTAGGSVSASTLGTSTCPGYVDRLPDALLSYSSPSSYLRISADGDSDLTLMVRSPAGTFSCNDDSRLGGLDPMVEFESPAEGSYAIWIGTLGEVGRQEAKLEFSELGAPSAGPGTGTPVTTLQGGFVPDPHVLNLTAGGSVAASAIGTSDCRGYVDRAPDARLSYSNPASYLSIFADGDIDLTLMVRSPSGVFSCNDDSPRGGLDPHLEFNSPTAGEYTIWIGTYSEGGSAQARLEISELRGGGGE